MIELLYRGFNCNMDYDDAMTPKSPSSNLEQGAQCGDSRVQCGDVDFTCGVSVNNTMHSHEHNGSGEPTCGLSTTPYFEVAKKYALGGGNFSNGYVVCLSVSKLKEAGVNIYRMCEYIKHPSKPLDDEHWLYFNGTFPSGAVVEKIHVHSD